MSAVDVIFNLFNSITTVLFYSWPFILLIWLFAMKKLWGRYPIEAIIIEKRGENLVKTNDRVGKFDELANDGTTYYKLKMAKDTIPIYNYDWILHNLYKPPTILERLVNLLRGNIGTIFLFRYGSKQYKPIDISENLDGSKLELKLIKDANGNPVYINQYVVIDPRNQLEKLNFDVIDWDNINFMVQEQRASIVRRQKKGEFWRQTVIPIVIIAAAVIVALFIMKFSMDVGRDLRNPTGVPTPKDDGGSKLLGGVQDTFTPGK